MYFLLIDDLLLQEMDSNHRLEGMGLVWSLSSYPALYLIGVRGFEPLLSCLLNSKIISLISTPKKQDGNNLRLSIYPIKLCDLYTEVAVPIFNKRGGNL